MSASAEHISIEQIDGQSLRVGRWPGQAPAPGLDLGSKPARSLLICCDFAVNLEVMADFCAQMSRPCIVMDWPGIGTSGKAHMRRMPALARVLARLMDALDLATVDLLGMGWGGLLAQQFARDYPERLGRLVLVATSPGPTMFPGRIANLRQLARRRGLQDLVVDGRAAKALFGGRREAECEAVAAALAHARAPTLRANAAQIFALTGFSSLTWAHRLKVPTLILAGDDDRIVPLANARLLAMLMAHAELSIMHASGHWLMIERQAEAIRRIEAFLALGETRGHS